MTPRLPRLVEADNDCPTCLQPRDMCDCDPVHARLVAVHEDQMLRAAADRAIKRGWAPTRGTRRGLWARLRDAWWAFWWGLE